ncbi:MAG: hypothetical protein AAF456_23175 [Planctomycetota bacterium]
MLKRLYLLLLACALVAPALSCVGCSDTPQAQNVEPPAEQQRDLSSRPAEDVTQAGIIRN